MATNETKMGSNCDSDRGKLLYCVQTRPRGSKLPHERVEHDLIWGCKLQILVSHRQGVIQDGTCPHIHFGLEIKKARVENKKERREGNFFIATSISKLLFGYL